MSGESTEIKKQIIYAGFWLRVIASIIDGLILAVADFILDELLSSVWFWFKWALPLAYTAGLNGSVYQGTVGKIILGIKVTDLFGNRISFKRAFARGCFMQVFSVLLLLCVIYWWAGALANNSLNTSIAMGLIIIILLVSVIGVVMVAFTARKQALHDIVCKTLVVKSSD